MSEMEVEEEQTPPVPDAAAEALERKAQAEKFKAQGNSYYSAKDYALAAAYYTKAIALCPEEATYLSNRAAANLMRQLYSDAVEDALKATVLDKTFIKAYLRAGKAYLCLGETDKALNMYAEALLLDPRNDEALEGKKTCDLASKRRERGLQLLKGGAVQRASQLIDAAMKDMPGDPHLRLAQIEVKVSNEELEDAMALSTSLLKEGRGGNKLLQMRARILYKQCNFPAAIKHLQQVLSILLSLVF